jgi:hypothetical protein
MSIPGKSGRGANPSFLISFQINLGVKHLILTLDFPIIYDIMILSSERGTRKEIETMYLFYADRLGWIPMGNDGMMKVPSSVRSNKKLIELATSWMGKRTGRIYLMTSWTQQMSELGPRAFEEYIAKHGKVVISV